MGNFSVTVYDHTRVSNGILYDIQKVESQIRVSRTPTNSVKKSSFNVYQTCTALSPLQRRTMTKEQIINYSQSTCICLSNRVATTDLSDNAIQPFETGHVKLFATGEIYNSKDIVKSNSQSPQSSCDLECVALLLERAALCEIADSTIVDTVCKLMGDYSFVGILLIQDPVRFQVCAGRDPLGIRPLYIITKKGYPNEIEFITEYQRYSRIHCQQKVYLHDYRVSSWVHLYFRGHQPRTFDDSCVFIRLLQRRVSVERTRRRIRTLRFAVQCYIRLCAHTCTLEL